MRAVLLLALAACGDEVGDFQSHFDLGSCGAVDIYPLLPGNHEAQGTVIDSWNSEPPTSGPHYPIWAAFGIQYTSLERAIWLHDAEHGAIVLLHRCDPASCPDTIRQLMDIALTFPADPLCEAPVNNRTIIVYDPLLPEGVEIAAVAWGKAYTATCVDPDAIESFRTMFYARGPENTCAKGVSFGGMPIE